MTDLGILLALAAAVGALAWWWRARQGVVRPTHGHLADDDRARLEAPADEALLVTFTAPGCTSCHSARTVLDDVASRSAVSVRSVDVADAPEFASRYRVMRAPTTLVVDRGGAVLARVGGVPRADELADALNGHDNRHDNGHADGNGSSAR